MRRALGTKDRVPRADRTSVTVRLYEKGRAPISRSHARRVLQGLEKFRHVILDFEKVKTVGQGFADEVFRVFANAHPGIELSPIHMAENVDFMVRRALGPRGA